MSNKIKKDMRIPYTGTFEFAGMSHKIKIKVQHWNELNNMFQKVTRTFIDKRKIERDEDGQLSQADIDKIANFMYQNAADFINNEIVPLVDGAKSTEVDDELMDVFVQHVFMMNKIGLTSKQIHGLKVTYTH